ncbi:MAG: DUF998 domain-containing protein [Chloroflexi bacterium]|nr:DUF998 domain-containing protein [Chloroflexota bacterium]
MTQTPRSITAVSQTAARLSFTTAATFVVLLAALHFLEPEFDPSWRFISEYALGRYGWIMALAFLSLAVSYAALFVAIQSQLRTIVGRIGLALLLISAVSFVMAGIFPTDPITTSPDAATTNGTLHNIGGTLGLAMTFAAVIVSWNLARNPVWLSARQSLLWTAGIAVACTVGFIVYVMAALPSDGTFGPNVLAGGIGRIEILAYCAWVMTVSRQAIKLQEKAQI